MVLRAGHSVASIETQHHDTMTCVNDTSRQLTRNSVREALIALCSFQRADYHPSESLNSHRRECEEASGQGSTLRRHLYCSDLASVRLVGLEPTLSGISALCLCHIGL